jgi:hypothetical protein
MNSVWNQEIRKGKIENGKADLAGTFISIFTLP